MQFRHVFFITLLVLAGSSAFAANDNHDVTGCQGNCPQTTEGGSSPAVSSSKSHSSSTSVASATGGAATSVAAGGNAQSTSGSTASTGDSNASSSSGDNSLTVNEARNRTVASTPAAVVGNTTAACRAFIGLSGMGRDGGGGLGFPLTDGDCKYGVLAEAAFNRGNRDLGARLFCLAPTVYKSIGYAACIESFSVEPQVHAVTTPDTYTKKEVDERLNRVALDAAKK